MNQADNSTITEEKPLSEIIIKYIAILISYKGLVIIITAIAAILSVAFAFASSRLPSEESPLPNIYRAYAVLLLQQEESQGIESLFGSLGMVPGFGGRSGPFDLGQLALKVLRSPAILDTLVNEFDIIRRYGISQSTRTYSREAILNRSDFSYEKSTGTLTVGFVSIDPRFSRNMVVRMIELLEEWFSSKGGTSKLKQKRVLGEKLTEVTSEISLLEAQVQTFQEKYGVLSFKEIASSQATLLGELQSQLILKEMEIKNYTQFTTIQDPALVKLKAERENFQAQISRIERGYTSPSGTIMPAKQELPRIALAFEKLVTALNMQRKIYEALSQQYEIAKLSVASEPLFQTLEAPEIPDMKSGPSRSMLCAMATFMAFAAAVVLVFLINSIKKMRSNPSILRKLTGKV